MSVFDDVTKFGGLGIARQALSRDGLGPLAAFSPLGAAASMAGIGGSQVDPRLYQTPGNVVQSNIAHNGINVPLSSLSHGNQFMDPAQLAQRLRTGMPQQAQQYMPQQQWNPYAYMGVPGQSMPQPTAGVFQQPQMPRMPQNPANIPPAAPTAPMTNVTPGTALSPQPAPPQARRALTPPTLPPQHTQRRQAGFGGL